MSTLSVIRFNKRISEFYARLKENRKQSTVAVPKIIIIEHSL